MPLRDQHFGYTVFKKASGPTENFEDDDAKK